MVDIEQGLDTSRQIVRRFEALGVNCEVFTLRQHLTKIRISENNITDCSSISTQFYNLRLEKDGLTSFIIRSDIKESDLRTLTKDSNLMMRAEWYCDDLAFSELRKEAPLPYTFDRKMCESSEEELCEMVSGVIKTIPAKMKGSLSRILWDKIISNPHGQVFEKSTSMVIDCVVTNSEGATLPINVSGRTLSNFRSELDRNPSNSMDVLKGLGKPTRIDRQEYRIILTPQSIGELLSKVVGPAVIAPRVSEGIGYFHNKLGKKVAHSELSLVDMHAMPGAIASERYDDEGFPTECTAIIDSGVFQNPVCNSYWGSITGFKNTSNASKGSVYKEPIYAVTKPSQFSIRGNSHNLSQNLKEYRKSIISFDCESTLLDISSGDFVSYLKSPAMVNSAGDLQHLKMLRFYGNVIELLSNIEKIGSENEQWFKFGNVPYYGPEVLLPRMKVEPL